MSEQFIFHGQTTFIDKPKDTVIQNFQNAFTSGDGSDRDKVNIEIIKLVELVLDSRDLEDDAKDESVHALQTVAEQIKEGSENKLTVKGTLTAVRDVVSKASDIAMPAIQIITTILRMLGLG